MIKKIVLAVILLSTGVLVCSYSYYGKGHWSTIVSDSAPTAREETAFVKVKDTFYLLGGRGIEPIDIYNPATNEWTQGSKPPKEVHHFQAVTYNDNIYIIGAMTGKYPHETPIDRILIYKPKTDEWVWGDTIPEARRRGSAGVVVDGDNAYVLCGITDGHWSGHVSWVDRYNFKTDKWTILPDAPRARDHFQAALDEGKIYCAGGRRSSAKTNQTFEFTVPEVDVYTITGKKWKTLPKTSNIPTQKAGASNVVWDGNLIVIGGESVQPMAHGETEALNVKTDKWHSWANLNTPRHGTQAILYKNQIYIVAGAGKQGGKPKLSSMEKFTK